MTNAEFDVLDELYFLQTYEYLTKSLNMSDEKLKSTLKKLVEKGWVKCYRSPTEEIAFESESFETAFCNYYYLASKQGLLAHNGTA
jgi:hypothetical protein